MVCVLGLLTSSFVVNLISSRHVPLQRLLPLLSEVVVMWTFSSIRIVNDMRHEWLSAAYYLRGGPLTIEAKLSNIEPSGPSSYVMHR